jgi:hypothetical protein
VHDEVGATINPVFGANDLGVIEVHYSPAQPTRMRSDT